MKDNQTIAQFLGITKFPFYIKDDYGIEIYFEDSDKDWWKREFDSDGNFTYYEDSNGFWRKSEFDSNRRVTYSEDSNKYWCKQEFDSNGHCTYYENSNKFWNNREFDSNGKETYYEDSYGISRGIKRSETGSLEGDILIHNGQTYKLVK